MEQTNVSYNARKRKRIEKAFTAKFRTSVTNAGDGESKWDMVFLKNLSAGGALFSYDKEVKMGQLLDFIINVPRSRGPIQCEAMIVRVENSPNAFTNRIATCFTDIKENDILDIDRLAQEAA